MGTLSILITNNKTLHLDNNEKVDVFVFYQILLLPTIDKV
jgi:hypothetical protein